MRASRCLAGAAVVTAVYAALTIYLAPVSLGPLTLRPAETLKPLVIWEPGLIPAFALGTLLGNLAVPFPGPWELVLMPFVNLVGGWLCWRAGRINAYLGAAIYAVVTAASITVMWGSQMRVPLRGLFLPVLAEQSILLLGGVPVMWTIHRIFDRLGSARTDPLRAR
jgi:QueT transporter